MRTENTLIKKFLEKLQQGYKERDINNINTFIKELFTEKEGLVVVGTGLNEWGTDHRGIEEIIKKQWTTEDEKFGKVDFNFEDARILEKEDTVFVCSMANVTRTISEESVCNKGLDNVGNILSEDNKEELKIVKASREIADILRNLNKGDSYKNPMRFTAMIVKENNEYKIHQMQFSFDACFFWQHRYLTEEEVLPMMKMDKPFSEAPEIRSVLKKFQEGYTKRDLDYMNKFTEIFTMDDNMITIGTDADEFFTGPEGLKDIIESDWQYWGDFKLNVDGAIIVQNEDTAYFTTKAMIKAAHNTEKMLEYASKSCQSDIEDEEIQSPKGKLLEALYSMTVFMHERELGENYYSPMRFSGFLIKRDGKWLIQHVQYSDYIKVPEKRI